MVQIYQQLSDLFFLKDKKPEDFSLVITQLFDGGKVI
jgi:hypothetical protein